MSPEYEAMLTRNLYWMLDQEADDPYYWGPKIRELSDRLGI